MKDVQQALDRLVPEPTRMSAWEEVLRDARPRRRSLAVQLLVATGIAALAALFVVAPWQGSERVGVLDRALAAVGDKPVLHVVLESPRTGDQLVDLESGRPVVTMVTTEVWFDEARGLKKSVSRIDGVLMDEMLETPEGGFTRGGVIYTCRWIAEHPAEAAKARVSCPGGERSSEPQPSLDPALANFVDHYRTALAAGNARRVTGNEVDGHDVIWIEFGTGRTLERVALDKSTYTPVLISTPYGSVRVRTAETMPFEQRLFSRPKPVERPMPAGGSVIAERDLENMFAGNAILGGRALWLGPEWRGLRLTSVKRQELGMSYAPRSEREPSRTVGVELGYSRGIQGATAIHVMETLSCQMAYAWTCQPPDPGEGMALLRGPMTLVRREGLFITILALQSDKSAALELARSLRPVSEP
jgi:hypothetical protein